MYGIQINDQRGGEILGMSDFTMRKIFEGNIPAISDGWTYNRYINSPLLFTVPGYVPSECVVIISPISYDGGEQWAGNTASALMTPTYRDMGGEVIGVIRFANELWDDRPNNRYLNRSRWCGRASIIEVFKVYGNGR